MFEDSGFDEEVQSYATRVVSETFNDFIFNFASNEWFQKSRICFPLHLQAFNDDFVIERKEWTFQNIFNGEDYYMIMFNTTEDSDIENSSDIESVDFENINLVDSVVRTMHFDKQEGKWRLTRQLLSRLSSHPRHEFLYFYHQFATDSLVRNRSLRSSIQYITTDPDDDFLQVDGTISADQWESFAPELPEKEITNINYGQRFDNPAKIVLIKRGISNGLADELHFHRSQAGWQLTKLVQ